MNGRVLYNSAKWPINIIAVLLGILPCKVRMFMFDFFSIFPTILGVALRYIVLKSLCKSVGDNVYLGRFVVLKNPQNVEIGSNVSIHDSCYIDGAGGVVIGDNTSIAHQTSIISFEHLYTEQDKPIKYNKLSYDKITISDDVWIGCGVRILSGVKIESRAIVAAGSVVLNNIESNTIHAGVPNKFVKDI
ncbi:acyltransferase [Vibrio parahaemolyticus]|nr:acyltransferase [Vibrio parahaemolyticus]